MSNNLLISCDWWQAHVDTSDYNPNHDFYNCQLTDLRSKTFREIWSISKDGRPCATLAMKPHSPRIPKTCGVLKIENYILYNENRVRIIDQITRDLQLWVKGTTRIDICGDFRRIAGRMPELLIRDIIEERIYKVGHSRAATIGEQDRDRQILTTYGTAGRVNTFSYLRYGSRTSRINTYMYNKSKELNEQTDKPYIRDMWRQNGWYGDKEVWRLEFSIRGHDMKFIEKETGEIMPNNPKLWLKNDIIPDIYMSLCKHYFDLRYKTQQRKDREERVELWGDAAPAQFLIKKLYTTKGGDRSAKIFIKKCATMASETDNPTLINMAASLGQEYGHAKGLTEWMKESGIEWKEVAPCIN